VAAIGGEHDIAGRRRREERAQRLEPADQPAAALGGRLPPELRGVMMTSGGRSRCVPRNVTTTLRATADVRLLTLTRRAGRRCAIASNTAGRSVLATCSAGGP